MREEKKGLRCVCGGVTALFATRKSKNSNWERVKEEDSTSVVLGPGNSFIQNAELKKKNNPNRLLIRSDASKVLLVSAELTFPF